MATLLRIGIQTIQVFIREKNQTHVTSGWRLGDNVYNLSKEKGTVSTQWELYWFPACFAQVIRKCRK